MKSRLTAALVATAAMVLVPTAASAQRQPPTPDQRLDRLERQVQEMQRQVYPKGRPADTAGFADDPAATQSSVISLDQRLDALERQMSDLLRQSEDSGNRLRSLESGIAQMRTDQEQRISAIEQRMAAAAAAAATAPPEAVPDEAPATIPTKTKPPTNPSTKPSGKPSAKPSTKTPPKTTAEALPTEPATADAAAAATDPGEDAYSEGFKLWQAGQYDEAIASLRAFTSAYPRHRRVSWANNLIGRALLDKGDAQGAAKAFLANYKNNPSGERAPDSLYYLGQALTRLGQPAHACNAYAELDAVYGAKVRPDLKKLESDAKAEAQCS